MIFEIPLQIYPFSIYVVFGVENNPEEYFVKVLSDTAISEEELNFLSKDEAIFNDYSGVFINMESTNNGLIYFPKAPSTIKDLSIVSHECFHAVCHIKRLLKVKLTKNSEETFAYLLDYLVNEILKRIDYETIASNQNRT